LCSFLTLMEPAEALPLLGFRRRNRALCPARVEIKKLCRHRASKRWSALLTQTKSRIGHKCGMRKRLGEANWAAFVRYATAQFKESFIRSLMPTSGVLCCEGTIHGAACPNHVHVDLMRTDTAQCAQQLPKLHMDHTHDVAHICDVWSQALPEEPRSWDDGVCGPLVAHLLFGTGPRPLPVQRATRLAQADCLSLRQRQERRRSACGAILPRRRQRPLRPYAARPRHPMAHSFPDCIGGGRRDHG